MGKSRPVGANRGSISRNLLRATLEHADYQLIRLQELKRQEYPFPASKHLVSVLEKIHEKTIKRLDSTLQELEKHPSDPNLEDDARIDAQRFGHLLSLLHSILQLLEFSSRAHISPASVHLIEDITESRTKSSKFLLTPTYEYNYFYFDVMTRIQMITERAYGRSTRPKGSPSSIAVLLYPDAYRENILANCLLGHEIGHFVVEQSGLVGRVTEHLVFDPNLFDAAVEEQKVQRIGTQMALTDFLSDQDIKQRTTEAATSILHRWVEELAADYFAISVLGLVFVYSLEKILLTMQSLDEFTFDHPTPRTRLRFLLNQSEQLNFIPDLKRLSDGRAKLAGEIVGYFDQISQLVVNQPVNRMGKLPAMHNLCEDELGRLTDSIIAEVSKAIASERYRRYSPDLMVDDIFVMYDALESFVPPCDNSRRKPGSVVSILNAGMAFMISGRELYHQFYDAKEIMKELEAEVKIRELIMKGIELSYLERRMRR